MSITNIDFYLNEIETSKKDIHQAIINKGGTPTGGLSSYADAINNIEIPKLVTGPLNVSYKDNGSYNINPSDYELDAFDTVKVNVNVPQSGGDSKPQIPNGFRFTGGQMIPGQTIFGLYDWSLVYDMTEFFKFVGCTEWDDSIWDDFEKNFNGKCLSANLMFWGCARMYKAPKLNTVGCLDMSGMFNECLNLTSVPEYDTSSCLNMSSMFISCKAITTIPLFNTSNVTNMSNMFAYCSSLTTIPELDLSSCTDINHMFDYCSSLTELPHMNTILCTNMYATFGQCKLLKSVSIDTSNTTDMKWCFNSCTSLESIIWTDTSNVTDMSYMLSDCSSLTSIPELDLSSCTNMHNTFNGCYKLGEIRFKGEPKSNVSVTNVFYNVGRDVENPIFYYDSRYDYSKIINVLPSKWTAVPYDVEEYEATLNQL